MKFKKTENVRTFLKLVSSYISAASKSLVKNRLDDNELDLLPMPVLMSDVLHGKLAPIFIREAVSACREVTSSCVPKIVQSLVHVTTEVALFSEQLMEELLRQYNNVSSGELKNLSSLLVEILVSSKSLNPIRVAGVILEIKCNVT